MKTTSSVKSTKRARAQTKSISKKRWMSYAAAGAATLVAGQETVDAGITHVDPADIPIAGQVNFDLNGDGSFDVAFLATSTYFSAGGVALGAGLPNSFGSNNGVVGVFAGAAPFPYVSNLPASSASVSANSPFLPPLGGTLAYGGGYTYSQFTNAGPGYVGVRFDSAAGTHYGWIRVTMLTGSPANQFTVDEWAYGMPGEAIHVGDTGIVPEPGSLGLLALGAAGLLAWRRKRSAAAA